MLNNCTSPCGESNGNLSGITPEKLTFVLLPRLAPQQLMSSLLSGSKAKVAWLLASSSPVSVCLVRLRVLKTVAPALFASGCAMASVSATVCRVLWIGTLVS